MEAGRTWALISGPASPELPPNGSSFSLPGPPQKGHVQWKSQSRHLRAIAPKKPDHEDLLGSLAAPGSAPDMASLSFLLTGERSGGGHSCLQ